MADGSFRQDLYYRLNVIEVAVPPLRERHEDIPDLCAAILARLIESGEAQANCQLDKAAAKQLQSYHFPGNVRELENILERAVTLSDGALITTADLQLRAAAPSATAADSAALPQQLEDTERQAIIEALEKTRYNKTKAAALLGMSFRSLRYRIKKLNIE